MGNRPLGELVGISLAVASAALASTHPSLRSRVASPDLAPATARSNIHPGDYVGPATCAECHEEEHARWREHPHSRMNANADSETVLGDFSGVELPYADGRARFDREGEQFFMTLWSPDGRRRYRVTRTVGSRFTQMYVGVQVEGPEPPDHPAYAREGKLPFGYWLSRGAWFPEPYFDSDCPPEFDAQGRVSLPPSEAHQTSWERNCIYCHNTYPYEERLREGTGTTGFPEADLSLRPSEDPAPGLRPAELVTLGISCESCHFGGREHAVDERPIQFLPTSPALTFPAASPERRARGRRDAYTVNGICSQCHFSRGVSPYPNGAGTWNSREAVDLLGGACASQLKCTDCHDPHTVGPVGGGPDQSSHVAACLSCHETLASPEARLDHTQHDAGSPGAPSCLDCHMPRIVQGLESVVRTHLISSPGDPRMFAAGAPNACNLCHVAKSLRWSAAALQIGWGRDVALAAERSEAHDSPAGLAWLASKTPSHRLVGADAVARSGKGAEWRTPLLRSLDDPIAVNRMFGLFAVERLLGRRLETADYTPTAPPQVRREQLRALLERFGSR